MNTAFSTWFGASKVVDEIRLPRVVYHGSRSPWVVQFDLKLEGTGIVMSAGGGSSRLGAIWFTSVRDNASTFADLAPKRKATGVQTYGRAPSVYASVEDRKGNSIFQLGPYATHELAQSHADIELARYNQKLRANTFVTAVYLSLQNPYILDGIVPRQEEFALARAAGHDGIAALEVVDGHYVSDCFVAFKPSQVKAVANVGTWSLTDFNIRN